MSKRGRGIRLVNRTEKKLISVAQRAQRVGDDQVGDGQQPLDERPPAGDVLVGMEFQLGGIGNGDRHWRPPCTTLVGRATGSSRRLETYLSRAFADVPYNGQPRLDRDGFGADPGLRAGPRARPLGVQGSSHVRPVVRGRSTSEAPGGPRPRQRWGGRSRCSAGRHGRRRSLRRSRRARSSDRSAGSTSPRPPPRTPRRRSAIEAPLRRSQRDARMTRGASRLQRCSRRL